MKKLGLHEIRSEFLKFFKEKSHTIIPSASLVPKDDKSLLLIGAGMAPLKKYFTGEAIPESSRMANCQRCIRTGDLENVGITDRHGTFFEMLGNFSFGDYFKEEAIEWAWEFLTEILELPKSDLWVTVYKDDDEAAKIWHEKIGIDKDRIVRLGKEDNFWELEVGPSGPSSEIYVDRGPNVGCGESTCQPGCECDRYLEIWNLVFTQFDKDSQGNYNPLPNPNIDTGMGLERVAAYIEGVGSIFEIEAIRDILNKVEELSKKKYGEDERDDISIRIITDHVRAMTFLVSDKVVPSNEGRGYVLRRIIRRAARHGKLLGINGSFLGTIIDEVINSWKVQYKELEKNKDYIKNIIKIEEQRFQETIDQGLEILDSYIKSMAEEGINKLDGLRAFKLYDTYGFPLDLTKEILEEKKFFVDEKGFEDYMEEQRQMARAARNNDDSGWMTEDDVKIYKDLSTKFKGYSDDSLESKVIGLFKNNEEIEKIKDNQKGLLIVAETPFYSEGGGQVGDKGEILGPNGRAKVIDTQATKKGHILHVIELIDGNIEVGDIVELKIDYNRRDFIKKNHTATHLLHQALKDILGESVNQAGSIVEEDRLRFDFSYPNKISKDNIGKIEKLVNKKIFENLKVDTVLTNISEAKDMGAIGLFEDKYSDEVRVLKIADYSIELCGGTHVKNTSEIGIFKILSETGVSAGIRRIEAITSKAVYEYLNSLEDKINYVEKAVKTDRNNLETKLDSILEDLSSSKKEIDTLTSKLAASATGDLIDKKEDIKGIDVIISKIDNIDMKGLRNLGDELKNKLGTGLVVLAGTKDSKLYFLVTASEDLIKKGIHSGKLIREIASVTGGSGGGRPDMAQAGGKDISKIDEALNKAKDLIENQLK